MVGDNGEDYYNCPGQKTKEQENHSFDRPLNHEFFTQRR